MNENAQKLVTALRSGDYKQGYGRLRGDDKFCCLGVACDIYIKECDEEWEPHPHFSSNFTCQGWHSRLPENIRKWLGFSTAYGDYQYGTQSLAYLNDIGANFQEIANVIESEPEGLFYN